VIFTVLAAGALMGTVPKLARAMRWLRATTDRAAGVKKEEVKQPVELLLSLEQFDRLMTNREVERAFIEARFDKQARKILALKEYGTVPCRWCGGPV
jgi:hypothetical protein